MPELGPELLPLHPIYAAINTVGGNPAKMLTLLVMDQQPDVWFTDAELQGGLNRAQGDEPGWRIGQGGGIGTYCRDGLAAAGLIEVGTKVGASGQVVEAYKMSDIGRFWGVPLFGALLDLEFGEFSGQKVLGATNSRSDAKDYMRVPLLRLRILEQVQAGEGRAVPRADLYRDLPRTEGAIDTSVDDLVSMGVLRAWNKIYPGHRILDISKPNMDWVRDRRSRRTAEAGAILDAAVALYGKGERTITGDALLQEAIRLYPGLKNKKTALWRAVVDRTPHCVAFADEHRYGPITKTAGPRASLEIDTNQEASVLSLLRTIQAVRASSAFRNLAIEQARRIMREPTTVAYLMAKSHAKSSHAKYPAFDAGKRLEALRDLRERVAGWLSLRSLLTFAGDWRNRANCRGEDPELFFGMAEHLNTKEADEARMVCNDCDVRLPCLKWAMEHQIEFGMWGGQSEEERRTMPDSMRSFLQLVRGLH